MYVKLLLFSNKNKINEVHYSNPSKVWLNSRGLHFGFIPTIILKITGEDKIPVLGILTERVRWISTYSKYHDYSLLLFKIKDSSCDTDGSRQELGTDTNFFDQMQWVAETESQLDPTHFLGEMGLC